MEYIEMLRRIVETALKTPAAFRMFVRLATDTLVCLGWDYDDARNFLCGLDGMEVPDLYAWEKDIHIALDERQTYHLLPKRMQERANDWLADLFQHLRIGGTILDYGCGGGYFAEAAGQACGCQASGADVKNCLQVGGVSFIKIMNCCAGTSQQFDRVFLNTVAHHSENPRRTVEDAWRLVVPGGQLIMVESVIEGPFHSFLCTALIDVWYNHIITYDADPALKTYVPCEFKRTLDWKAELFRITGIEAEATPLGIHMVLNPEDHVKFRVEKPPSQ